MRLRIVLSGLAVALTICAAHAESSKNISDLVKQGYRLVSVVPGDDKNSFVAFLEKGEGIYVCPLQFKRDGVEYKTGPWTDYAACEKVTPRAEVPK